MQNQNRKKTEGHRVKIILIDEKWNGSSSDAVDNRGVSRNCLSATFRIVDKSHVGWVVSIDLLRFLR